MGDKSLKEIEQYSASRPIWFIYSGMGSQWIGMGRDLLNIEVFRQTFDRCALALQPYGIDLYHIVTTSENIMKDIYQSALGITAIQVGLTDVLYSFGIIPDGMAGHSLGEVGKNFFIDR